MRASTRIIIIVTALLVAAVAILAVLNRGDAQLKAALSQEGEFEVYSDGIKAATVSMKDIGEIGPVEFETRMATSVSSARDVKLAGVELRALFEHFGIEYGSADTCEVKGLDGYVSALAAGEISQPGKVYICVAMDQKPLGTKQEGGLGPYMMVIAGEQFSLRWCKYVERVELK